MKSIKTSIILHLFMLSIFTLSFAQEAIQYTYDPSGNRIERSIVLLPPENPGGNNQGEEQEYKYDEQQKEYSDVLNDHEITIFPNPNGGQFDVVITNLNEVIESVITLYSVAGEPLLNRKNPEETEHFDIRHLRNGTYLLTIQLDKEQTTWKIIKQ